MGPHSLQSPARDPATNGDSPNLATYAVIWFVATMSEQLLFLRPCSTPQLLQELSLFPFDVN
eukprot:944401-Amphidinium_carterae.2